MDQPNSRRGSSASESSKPPLSVALSESSNQPLRTPSGLSSWATEIAERAAIRRSRKPKRMADPFEVRMRFTSQLQHLNASVTSSQKAANYALKYKDMDEDLHSCILEQLEKNNMNVRANIMYFIEHFCEMAHREGHEDYVRMMQRDILQVVDAVTPEDGSGAANIKVVRKVLQALHLKKFLSAQTLQELEECLQSRGNESASDALPAQNATTSRSRQVSSQGSTNAPRLDKKQIEQRIEEDRERHKRARESIWAIPFQSSLPQPISQVSSTSTAPPGGENGTITWDDDPEFERLWAETSELGEDDYDLFEEEYQERKKAAAAHEEEYKSLSTFGAGEN